ncbi:pyridoxal phosphate-dependent aminotransferase [Amphibacillus cookii]|uniref:pyridoxal phosphate-dependent aminotransferase n=1 Tax=Amphibacillus cookii TaxID=767787 RepID=UPI00195E6ACE|nr:pyridoxal phosphate-dependent aminotransferase [Amphibacillus cookii]MBM7542539.1 aspartate aminotransferase [Amphibacillus cookii]
MQLANRVQKITPSSTLAITAKAKALKQAGHDVIGLGAGEPDFNTPNFIIKAAEHAMHTGLTRYTPAGGILELKEAITNKMYRDHQLSYHPDQVVVTTGAKHALFTLFQVLLNKGDEVIVPAPYWVSYPEQIKLAEGTPIFVTGEEKNHFKLTAKQLEEAITAKTKAVIINSPSNPTGMMYTKEELKAIGDVCLKHNLLIVSDEIYEKLTYTDQEHISISQLSNQLKEQTVIINGVSKSHAMTGWRIGYAVGSKTLIKAMSNLISHSTSNPTTIAQYGALAAYQANDDEIVKMKQAFKERLDRTYELLTQVPGINCLKPMGAFYLFPNVSEAMKKTGFDSIEAWVTAILEEEKVALVPGSGFGAPDNVRLSYAIELDQLEKAIDRIQHFINRHQQI